MSNFKTDNTSEVDPDFLEKYRRDVFVHSCDKSYLEENEKLKKEVSTLKEALKFYSNFDKNFFQRNGKVFELLDNNDCVDEYPFGTYAKSFLKK